MVFSFTKYNQIPAAEAGWYLIHLLWCVLLGNETYAFTTPKWRHKSSMLCVPLESIYPHRSEAGLFFNLKLNDSHFDLQSNPR